MTSQERAELPQRPRAGRKSDRPMLAAKYEIRVLVRPRSSVHSSWLNTGIYAALRTCGYSASPNHDRVVMSGSKAALKAVKAALDSQKYEDAAAQAKKLLEVDAKNYHA